MLRAVVISGEVFGVKGPIEVAVPPYFIDFHLKKSAHMIIPYLLARILCHCVQRRITGNQGNHSMIENDCAGFVTNEKSEELKAKSEDTVFVLLAARSTP